MGQERDFFPHPDSVFLKVVRVYRSNGISVRVVKTTYHVTYRSHRHGLPSPSPRPTRKCFGCVFFLLRPTGKTRSSMRHAYMRRNQLVTQQRHSSDVIRLSFVSPTTIRACFEGGRWSTNARFCLIGERKAPPPPTAEQWKSERRFNDRVVCRPVDNEPRTTRPENRSKYNIRVLRDDEYCATPV